MLKARHGRLLVTILALALLAALARWLEDSPAPHNPSSADRQSETSSFDYYLIALSWSPTWCEDNPRDQEQCGSRGFGFILENGSNERFFVHVSELDGPVQDGQTVTFDVERGARGMNAVRVSKG